MTKERRRHARVDVAVLVQIRYNASETPKTVYATNISESGLFLDIDDGKPVGTRVFVQVTTTDGNQLLRGDGRVVRREDGGVGVELTGFDEAARAVLRALAERARGA